MKAVRFLSVALLTGMFVSVPAQAQSLRETAQNATALAIINRYISSGCQDPAAYELRADIKKAMGKSEAAEADYEKAAALVLENFDKFGREVAKAN